MAVRSLYKAFAYGGRGGSMPVAGRPHWLAHHLLWPVLVFAVAIMVLGPLHGDLWIADQLYAIEGHAWSLKDHFVTEHLIHMGGKRLSVLAWLAILIAWMMSWRAPALREWRRPLLYLWVSVLLATALVSAVKRGSGLDCPWDLLRYGGDRPYFGLFSSRPAWMPAASCFPAGHASAGYAWVSLYFFFLVLRPAWRWWGLAIGLAAGVAFGIAQQLRGAHFLSHDLWSLMICWSSALVLYMGMRAPRSTTTADKTDNASGVSTASMPGSAMAGSAR
jgi:membrane-associated PAP2 superfamily phosphatase